MAHARRARARASRGWETVGHPEWGAFRLGKPNPAHTTSGLLQTIAVSRLDDARAAAALEASVVFYGDASWAFLDNWFRLDRKRQPLSSFVSAVVTDERAVVAYNAGSPNGVIPENHDLKRPHTKLASITPDGRRARQRLPDDRAQRVVGHRCPARGCRGVR